MKFLLFSLLSASAITSVAAKCSSVWNQCGGKGYTGPTCCEAGTYCSYNSDWWSQCKPGPDPNPPGKVCVAVWGQCGGMGYNGPGCCTVGSSCHYYDGWYSQCIPDTISKRDDPAPPPVACSRWWEQCGGNDWTGPSCCSEGSECVYSNQWYSQCKPKPNTATGGDGRQCANIWGQCGGKTYTGSTCCQEGSECVKQDDWYSQCQPMSGVLQGRDAGPADNVKRHTFAVVAN